MRGTRMPVLRISPEGEEGNVLPQKRWAPAQRLARQEPIPYAILTLCCDVQSVRPLVAREPSRGCVYGS